jgi:putative membrane protein
MVNTAHQLMAHIVLKGLKGGLMHYWYWSSGGHMIWMTISWLVGIGLFSMLIWLLASAISRGPESGGSPEEILRRRFAAGEIDSDEYERRLDELRKTSAA